MITPVSYAGLRLVGALLQRGFLEGPWKVDMPRTLQVLRAAPAPERGDRHAWVYEALALMRAQQPIEPDDVMKITLLLYAEADALEKALA